MVDALALTQFQRIENQTNVAMLGKPGRVMLIVDFAAIGDTVDDGIGVATNVQDRRCWKRSLLRNIEIGGDIKPRARLEVQFFNGEVLGIYFAGDDGLQVGPGRHGPEADHLQKLPAQLGSLFLPVFLGLDVGGTRVGNLLNLMPEIIFQHLLAAGQAVNRLEGVQRRRTAGKMKPNAYGQA